MMTVVTVASLDGFYHRRCWRPDEHDVALPALLMSRSSWMIRWCSLAGDDVWQARRSCMGFCS
jgi:hypothetical protein